MPSSIFSSRSKALAHIKLVCAISAMFMVLLEILSAHLLDRYSVTYRRVSQELMEAMRARASQPGQPASMVIIGNSLFLDGVQVEKLSELTSPHFRIYPVFLEGTGYYDWLYGLRRIFQHGARPQVVVVQFEVNSFLWRRVRTEYSPMLFFDTPDILRVGSDLALDRTAITSLLFAHWSSFWGTHSVVRTQILRHMIPHFEELFSLVPVQRTPMQRTDPFGQEFRSTAQSRLKTLRDLCNQYGARVVMLVPPTPSSQDAVRKLVSVSLQFGVPTLVPIDATTLTPRHYEADALHLNAEGAALFTQAIARISEDLL